MSYTFASDTPGYGSGWHAYHNGERYDGTYLAALNNSGEWGNGGFVRGYRAAANGLSLYDEIYTGS
jgi:hypothetical protein